MTKAMKKINTRPRPHVALLVETTLASGRDILRGISRYVRENASWSLYYEPRGLEESPPKWLRKWKGDGIIARIQNQSIAQEVLASGIPTVDVLGVVPDTAFPLVHVNDAHIARTAAEHLIERGFKNFGYFGIGGENWSERRRDAFEQTIHSSGGVLRVYEPPRSGDNAHSWEQTQDALAAWVAQLPKPVGVMVCSDQRGPQFLEACRRAGVAVPDEVAVIGVDDDQPLCEVCNPPLSSVQPGHDRVGYAAAELLARIMAGQVSPTEPQLVDSKGVSVRLSTDVYAIEDRALSTALRWIRENACAPISVDAIARHAGLSRSVLQRRFRVLLQRSVHQEILNTRIKRARELLAETNLPLGDIAEKTGFKHQEYMGAVFKTHLKKTPAQYRRAMAAAF